MRRSPGLGFALLFVLLGLPFLRLTGLHFDASFELGAFYDCSRPAFSVEWFGVRLPIMVIFYLGALKSWLYLPILYWLEVTPFVLRLPTLLVGAGSVWMFFTLVDRTVGRTVALVAAALLVTDISFLIATAYDFGPVAFLHFCFLAGVLLLLRFERTGAMKWLALAFFLFGVALWDKALFIWMLGSLGASTVAVFPWRLWKQVTLKRVAVAAGSLALGAAPLVFFNVETGGATLHPEQVISDPQTLVHKWHVLAHTFEGSAYFGFLTDELSKGTDVRPPRIWGRASAAINRSLGDLHGNGMLFALFASFALLPWLWFTPARRPAVFAAVYLFLTWVQMQILPGTGASVHHVILLWPFPHLLMAIAGAQLAARIGRQGPRIMAALLVLMLAWNLAIVNQLFAQLETKGSSPLWTDATQPLVFELQSMPLKRVITVDWGYETTLCLLSDGQLPLWDIGYDLMSPSVDTEKILWMMSEPLNVFVGHAPGAEIFPGVHARLEKIAADAGLHPRVESVVRDRNGRARFYLMKFEK